VREAVVVTTSSSIPEWLNKQQPLGADVAALSSIENINQQRQTGQQETADHAPIAVRIKGVSPQSQHHRCAQPDEKIRLK